MNKLQLKGLIPPMITPLLDNDVLDVEGAKKLTEHMIAGGVDALFVLGTTGEAQSLTYRLRYEYVELICSTVAGRVPVIVGITDSSFDESIRLAHHAKKCGAVGCVAAAPYYFPATQKELIDYYTALADACPLPLFLYNMPSKVKVFLNVSTVLTLSKHPNIAGVKDSSGNAGYFASLLHHFKDNPEFSVYMGPEEVTAPAILMGADGGVNGGANLFPELFSAMTKAAAAGDLAKVQELNDKIQFMSATLYGLCDSDASFMKALKLALELHGICSGNLAWPYRRCDEKETAAVKAALAELDARNYR
ncbi:MAG: dihydrodipicolinate synthase family protein [Bacteroidales bacterium]|nr:dihydrodipicolinate synthase family protein [Bacteroidales bacterium]